MNSMRIHGQQPNPLLLAQHVPHRTVVEGTFGVPKWTKTEDVQLDIVELYTETVGSGRSPGQLTGPLAVLLFQGFVVDPRSMLRGHAPEALELKVQVDVVMSKCGSPSLVLLNMEQNKDTIKHLTQDHDADISNIQDLEIPSPPFLYQKYPPAFPPA